MENNQMQVFESEQFGQVRTVIKDGEPWFVAKDVCRALEIVNAKDAMKRLDDDEKSGVGLTDPHGRTQVTNVVNEPGLYALVLGSRKPEAKAFKRWITHDVIPSIRKHGGYIAGQETMSDVELLARAVLTANHIIEEKTRQLQAASEKITILEPKAAYCDAVLACPNAIPVSVIAKDYGMSAMSMNRKLHDLGIQYKIGDHWLLYQKYADKDYVKTETIIDRFGKARVNTRWTQSGRLFLYKKLKEEASLLPIMERNIENVG